MRRILCVVLTIALASVLFAGCADTPAPAAPTQAPAAPTAPTQAPAGPAVPTEAPKEGWDFSDARNVNLAFATYMPDTDPTTLDMVKYFELVKEYSEGTIDYTVYANQSLVNGAEGFEATVNGLCDVAYFPVGYGSGILPMSYMLEYPGIRYESQEALAYTIRDWFDTVEPGEVSPVKRLFAYGQGGGVFATTFPLREFSDFSGRQIRSVAALLPVIEAFGATGTFMVIGEVYEALRTGVIDGHYGIAVAIEVNKIHEVTQYILIDPFYLGSYLMIMNTDTWNSLTPDQQAAMDAAAQDGFDVFIAPGREKENAEAVEICRNAGLEINHFTDGEYAKMAAAAGSIQAEYAAGVPGGPEALAVLEQLAAKYNAIYK